MSVLPSWAQTISLFIPTSYVFEQARSILIKGSIESDKLVISLLLNIIYLVVATVFIKRSFNKALDKGLVNAN